MTNVSYEVVTPVGSTVVKSLQRAIEIVAEKGGSYKTKYEKVVEKSHMTPTRQTWLKQKWGQA
jgi:hypothetical protein